MLAQMIIQKSHLATQHPLKYLSNMYLLVDNLLPVTSKLVVLSLAVF